MLWGLVYQFTNSHYFLYSLCFVYWAMHSIGKYSFVIEGTAGTGLKYAIFNALQQAAAEHADRNGFGQQKLINEGLIWAMSRINVEYDNVSAEDGDIDIETYVKTISGLLTEREFVVNQNSVRIASASSLWFCLDSVRRRPVRIPEHIVQKMQPLDLSATKSGIEKIIPVELPADEEKMIIATLADEDMAGHINNASYVRWVFEDLALRGISEDQITKLSVNYLREGNAGRLLLEKRALEPDQVLYSFKNVSDNSDICLVNLHRIKNPAKKY